MHSQLLVKKLGEREQTLQFQGVKLNSYLEKLKGYASSQYDERMHQ